MTYRTLVFALSCILLAQVAAAGMDPSGAAPFAGAAPCQTCPKQHILGNPFACTDVDNIPAQGATGHQGMCFDEWGGFWTVMNNNPFTLVKVDPANGNVLKTLNPTIANYAFDMDWYNHHFWVGAFTTGQIYKFDTLGTNLGIVNTVFGSQVRGMAFSGGYMWLFLTGGAVGAGQLVRCDTTGTEIARYPIGTIFQWCMGATPGPSVDPDTTFWCTDNNTANDIKRITVSGSTVTLVETCTHPASSQTPSGITFDPGNLIRTWGFYGTAIYRIDAAYSGVEKGGNVALPPSGYALGHARPNPASGRTEISFTLPKEGAVSLKVYNAQGQLVRTLLSATKAAGTYSASWDGSTESGLQAGSGVYFYRMESGSFSQTRNLSYIR